MPAGVRRSPPGGPVGSRRTACRPCCIATNRSTRSGTDVPRTGTSHGEVRAVRTEFIPTHDVPAVIPEERTAATLEQARLAGIDSPTKLAAALRPIVDEYRSLDRGAVASR